MSEKQNRQQGGQDRNVKMEMGKTSTKIYL